MVRGAPRFHPTVGVSEGPGVGCRVFEEGYRGVLPEMAPVHGLCLSWPFDVDAALARPCSDDVFSLPGMEFPAGSAFAAEDWDSAPFGQGLDMEGLE